MSDDWGIHMTWKAVPPSRPDVLSEATETLVMRGNRLREEQIRVCLNPRPRWMPAWVWARLIKLMLHRESQVRF